MRFYGAEYNNNERGEAEFNIVVLHRNCFLLINMLENFIKFENFQKKIQNYKIKKKFKGQFFLKFENFNFVCKL
jgi:hypothetical protein